MAVPQELAQQFLFQFARAEYALKGVKGFCDGDEGKRAKPNWDAFASAIAEHLAGHPRVDKETRELLLNQPPKVELVRDGVAKFEDKPLCERPDGQRLIEAMKRVRNNLFHGGKENPEQYPGRDERLVEAALTVLHVAMECAPEEIQRRFVR